MKFSSKSRTSSIITRLDEIAGGPYREKGYRQLSFSGAGTDKALSYQVLRERAIALAHRLVSVGSAGDRVLLCFVSPLEFAVGFFACLYSKRIAVPAYPPIGIRDTDRLDAIIRDAEPGLILTDLDADIVTRWASENTIRQRPSVLFALGSSERATEVPTDGFDAEGVAFLQYTSGSTGTPRGVAVTHNNIAENEEIIRAAFEHDQSAVVVGWLPMFHDMGLIGNLLQPIWTGADSILMSPTQFLQKPVRWLKAISDYRATTSGGPNFAYQLCVDKVSDDETLTLDLTSWRTAFNGSEPVNADTLARFAARFSRCGFRPESFFPCYGLAEATLFVTGGRCVTKSFEVAPLNQGRAIATDDVTASRTLVSSGPIPLDGSVKVVDPLSGRELAPNHVGEIFVHGASVAKGYWNKRTETEATFHASLFASPSGASYLRTGDLGFVADGELFISGRIKDLIIIRGENIYPNDVESAARVCLQSYAIRAVCAFSIPVGASEEIAVAFEAKDWVSGAEGEASFNRLRTDIGKAIGYPPALIVVVRPGAIPKTTSGKIRRLECRERVISKTIAVIDERRWTRSTQSTEHGRERVRDVLERLTGEESRSLDPDSTIGELGLDSLAVAEIGAAYEEQTGEIRPLFEIFRSKWSELVEDSERLELPAQHAEALERKADLTVNQLAIWYTQESAPDSTAYSLCRAVRVNARIDPKKLQVAFNKIVAASEELRAVFPLVENRVSRHILPLSSFVCDFAPEMLAEDLVGEVVDRFRSRPFRLARDPLIRCMLTWIEDDCSLILLNIHHLVADHRSMVLIWTALLEGALGESAGSSLPAEQFHAVIIDESRYLASKRAQLDILFWKDAISNRLTGAGIRPDFTRPLVNRMDGDFVQLHIEAPVLSKLKELAREAQVTLFAVLLGTYSTYISRMSEGATCAIGVPFSVRRGRRFENVIGYCVNTLPVIIPFDPLSTVIQHVSRVGRLLTDALEHSRYPFSQLVPDLKLPRKAGENPLFQQSFVMLGDHHAASMVLGIDSEEEFEIGGRKVRSILGRQPGAQVDVGVALAEGNNGLLGTIEFNSAIFKRETISRFAEGFVDFARRFAAASHEAVSNICNVSDAEREQMESWNRTQVNYEEGDVLLHELFEKQVEKTPTAIALSYGESTLTYARLNELAEAVATDLRSYGLRPGDYVGICMERSLEMVISMYGTLKAGGAYVPIDPEYPDERLAFVLHDSGISVLLTGPGTPDSVRSEKAIIEVDVRQLAGATAGKNSGPKPDRGSPAYMIYTSGSTGKPKGAIVHHQAIVNRILWMQDALKLSSEDVILQKTPYSFDVSVWEFFWPLAIGAKLCLAAPGGHRDPAYLVELIQREKITTLHFVPSMLHVFLEEPGVNELGSIRRVVCSGEALGSGLVRRFFELSSAALHNLYGPTETAVDVTWWHCQRDAIPELTPIGRPIANVHAYILDPYLQQVPIGTAGELHIGGVAVGLGYKNREELTQSKFISDPFLSAGRLYKTGDLVRFRSDGEIEYLGRIDHQVKIRGNRVELGEIDVAIRQYALISDVVVAAVETSERGKRLVAYLVAPSAPSDLITGLRLHLSTKLPDYMVPSEYVLLKALPLLPNGKVDRKALPVPSETPVPQSQQRYVAPSTPNEIILTEVWEKVLRHTPIGIHDNYFEIGGDSILSIQIKSLAGRRGLAFQLQDFFSSPCISKLAAVAKSTLGDYDQHETLPFSLLETSEAEALRGRCEDAYPLSALQQGMVFHSEFDPTAAHYQVVFSFCLSGPMDTLLFSKAVGALASRHENLRTSFDFSSFGRAIQVVSSAGSVPLQIFDISNCPESEQNKIIKEWISDQERFKFSWDKPPFLRLSLHLLRPDRYRFGVIFHDSIFDGWSAASLISELFRDYVRLLRKEPQTHLEPPQVKYRDFIKEEIFAASSEKHGAFWKAYIEHAPFAKIPRRSDRAQGDGASRDVIRVIAGNLLTALKKTASDAGVSLKTIFLAAHMRAISLISHESDVVTGLVCNGRPEQEGVERILGNFLNTVPFRVNVRGGTWRTLVSDVQRAEMELLHYRRYPNASIQRIAGRPLFEAAFNYIHFHVYDDLTKLSEIRYEGGVFTDPFHYPFTPNFRVRPGVEQVDMALNYNSGELDFRQVEEYADVYLGILSSMAQSLGNSYDLPTAPTRLAIENVDNGVPRGATEVSRIQLQQYVGPVTSREVLLTETWEKVLRRAPIGVHDNYFEIGGDSILSIQISSKLKLKGIRLTPKDIFQSPTIFELAKKNEESETVQYPQNRITGRMGMTAYQGSFLNLKNSNPSHWNMALLLERQSTTLFNSAHVHAAVHAIQDHHDVLRSQFIPRGQGWVSEILEHCGDSYSFTEITSETDLSLTDEVSKVADATQREFNIERGEVFLVRHIRDARTGREWLFFVAHHLVVDAVSWAIILEDFFSYYSALARNSPAILPPKTASFGQWTSALTAYLDSELFQREVGYWTDPALNMIEPLPKDFDLGQPMEGATHRRTLSVSAELTARILDRVCQQGNVSPRDALIAAASMGLAECFGRNGFLLAVESHGRDELPQPLDTTRTVGCFTAVVPILVHVERGNIEAVLACVKKTMDSIPRGGIPIGIQRAQAGTKSLLLVKPEVGFNYLGRIDHVLPGDSLCKRSSISVGTYTADANEKAYYIDILGGLVGSTLELQICLSSRHFAEPTAGKVFAEIQKALETTAELSDSAIAHLSLSSRFPRTGLSTVDLGELYNQIG